MPPLRRAVLALAPLTVLVALPAWALGWGDVTGPSAGAPRVIGAHGAGCLAGAAELPPEGTGYQTVDGSRRRHFGHPDLVAFVRDLGRAAVEAGLGMLLVGDMAQPRGGPMTYGHVSHQTGLDVDVFFRLDVPPLPRAEREGLSLPDFVDPRTRRVRPAMWTDRHAALVRLAASDDRVSRVFVGAAIKRDLCERTWPDRGWLRRVRPWPAHDDHLHVRLRCPEGSPDCVDQSPPRGEGCGPELDREPRARRRAPRRALPAACGAVLNAAGR